MHIFWYLKEERFKTSSKSHLSNKKFVVNFLVISRKQSPTIPALFWKSRHFVVEINKMNINFFWSHQFVRWKFVDSGKFLFNWFLFECITKTLIVLVTAPSWSTRFSCCLCMLLKVGNNHRLYMKSKSDTKTALSPPYRQPKQIQGHRMDSTPYTQGRMPIKFWCFPMSTFLTWF